MSGNPTASALERVDACVASHVLPRVATTNEHAERGTTIAGFIREVLAGASPDSAMATAGVPAEWAETCRKLRFDQLVGDMVDVRGEVAFAYDTATGGVRELGVNLGRKYPPTRATEIVGTVDIIGRCVTGIPVVADVKTGQPVTRARENHQIMFFALVAQRLTGAPEVEARIQYVREDGGVYADQHVFTLFDLDMFAEHLSELLDRVNAARAKADAGGVLNVSSGDHCRYCDAMIACPRYVGLAREIGRGAVGGELEDIKRRLELLPPEQVGVVWTRVREIEKLVEHVVDSVKEIARKTPIPLESGKELRETRSSSSRMNVNATVDLLRAKGATQAEIDALWTTTPTFPVKEVKPKGAPRLPRKGKAA